MVENGGFLSASREVISAFCMTALRNVRTNISWVAVSCGCWRTHSSKAPRDGFLAGRKPRDIEDVAEEIGEAGLGLVVGFAKTLLGHEKIRTIQHGGNGFDVVGGEFFAALQVVAERDCRRQGL